MILVPAPASLHAAARPARLERLPTTPTGPLGQRFEVGCYALRDLVGQGHGAEPQGAVAPAASQ
jgi:hypothetical protein